MNSDVEQLLRTAAYGSNAPNPSVVLAVLPAEGQATAQSTGRPGSSTSSATDTAAMAAELKKLVDAATATQASNVAPPSSSPSAPASEGPGVGETLLRTAAMMTGVGPIVTGIMKLFGSDDPEPLPALERFEAPARVSVEAGLTQDRRYSAIRYAQNTPEALDQAPTDRGPAPTIQVNIQALDSQSFLDRQEDVARAVREAMLHSNSLNDVVMEL